VNEKEVNQIFEKFQKMRVVVIGDSMVDVYLWGKVDRVSPEAPIPIVSVTKRETRLGGAANVSLNLQSLGATPVLFSVVGDDDKGRKFRKMIEAKNLPGQGIFIDPARITTVKSRIIGMGQHIARVDEESTEMIHPGLEQKLLEGISLELASNHVDAIIFVDYDKGVITPTLIDTVRKMAREKNIPVAADPKQRNFRHYRDIDLFKPNFKEFVEGTGVHFGKNDLEALNKAACALKEEQNFKLIFITLSEMGVFISNGVQEQYYPAVIRHIADVSGAGDSVISVAGLAMAAKIPIHTMALMANIAGGLVCELPGVVPVDRERLMQVMKLQKL
jgi:D-glycero-beta-D-manno-heptose-7-phosphate kinase